MSPSVTLLVVGLALNTLNVAILLEELGIEYELIHKVCFPQWDGPDGVKNPEFLKINPSVIQFNTCSEKSKLSLFSLSQKWSYACTHRPY